MGQLSERLKDAQFYGILDSGYVSRADMYSKCSQLINAGTKIIQLRAKLQTHSQRREIALEILPLFQRECVPFFVINDDAELAASLPGAGLHIGQDDIPPAAARKIIGGGRVLGLSTHSIEQAKSADALNGILDYFAVGPVFATNTKLQKIIPTANPNLPPPKLVSSSKIPAIIVLITIKLQTTKSFSNKKPALLFLLSVDKIK